jgi:hypothetical protein
MFAPYTLSFVLVGGRFLGQEKEGQWLKRRTVAKVIERVRARYEVQDVEFGKVYKWRPERVLVECECGENQTLSASRHACEECGADHRPVVEQVLEAHPEEGEKEGFDHPWRSLHPYYAPTRGT